MGTPADVLGLKSLRDEPKMTFYAHRGMSWLSPCGRRSGSYPTVPFEGFLQLEVLPSFAGQVHPFPFEPFDSGLSKKIFGLDFSYKGDIST